MKITNVNTVMKMASKEIYMASDCEDGLHLMIHVPVPIEIDHDFEYVCRKFYLKQAKILFEKLKNALPQGTMDHLFALMAKEKASILKGL